MTHDYLLVYFFLPKSFIEKAISWWEAELGQKIHGTWRHIPCHVGMAVNDKYYDISYSGFRCLDLGVASKHFSDYYLIKVPKREIIMDELKKFLSKSSLVTYDYYGLFHFVFPFIKQRKRQYYCSEFVARALESSFVHRIYRKLLSKEYITPYQLYKVLKIAFNTDLVSAGG